MAETKTKGAEYSAPVSGDPEVEVTRQQGVTFEQASAGDPFVDMPVIQVDPETVVTRQQGVHMVDGGDGVVMADRPLTGQTGRVVSDVRGDPKKDYGFEGYPGVVPAGAAVVDVVPGSEDTVERIKGEQKDDEGNLIADTLAPGVQLVTLPEHMLTAEQRAYFDAMREAAASGKPFPSDQLGAADTVIVHDPVKHMREQAAASESVPNDEAQKRARKVAAAAKAREVKAAKAGKAQGAPDPASVQQQQLQEALQQADNGPAARQAEGAALKDGGQGAKPGEVEL